jgi:Mg2+ and Co2+ transporter CorA
MLANKSFASKAQNSADEMEKLTKQTKRETVSMKVITLVTMAFLPGTFISVRVSLQ